ncbi:MAG TPA: L-aspartate oxidase [Intrasporangium sp.]|uniref:L-aspartate oxidase n=1 Tax=Intrasporangium sp. TaxID=1925024 RepID=UPI002D77C37F|nr:L-aspartate oxidase [Intrasporangium sp.]HET7397330.1 L-aspartate oxidase [Intrasporangium sp.]
MTRVAVVGAGAAGMLTALRLAAYADVVLLTKGALGDGNTGWAQGGIAAAVGPGDSPDLHASDTLAAAAGLADAQVVRLLSGAGPACVRELAELGVGFDTDGAGPALGLEAAHSVSRVLHAGGDATGAAIARALARAVRVSDVDVREHRFVTDLVLGGSRVAGVEALGPHGREVLYVDEVVLASGGAGSLYAFSTNPVGATADGVAIAARAGALLADLEFLQFHPTALAGPDTFLVSEAVRGAGAVLRDESGRRFLGDVHPAGELAPRDVVARGIAAAMARQHGRPVTLDATGVPDLARRFPSIHRAVTARGCDWTREGVPVAPAAHYWMGGVATDAEGRTSLPGLWAVGEVACTGVHGANRLASNSLLEALVFAARCAEAMRDGADRPLDAPVDVPVDAQPLPETSSTSTGLPVDVPFSRPDLQATMWIGAGLVRSRESLEAAAATLAAWRRSMREPDSVADLEDANLLLAGALLVDAALQRRESRGAHFRADHPHPDPGQAVRRLRRIPATAPTLTERSPGWR